MKKILIPALAIFLLSACNNNKVVLFNGENLDNWSRFTPGVEQQDSVFRVENGLLYVSGIPHAYIRTSGEYENYKLHLEWRWVAEPANSGVLIHTTGEDLLFPNCIEAQLKHQQAGDFVLMGKGTGITIQDSTYVVPSRENRYLAIKKMKESTEKPAGEWNSYDIIAHNDTIELYVNGKLQNRGTGATKTSGSICLQSEGGPMQFRNIYLEKLH